MKKFIAVVAALFCFVGFTFADDLEELQRDPNAVDLSVQTIVPEDQHTTNKTAKVEIVYTPLTDEAHVYYTCVAVTYDQGEAMNTVLVRTLFCSLIFQDTEKKTKYAIWVQVAE